KISNLSLRLGDRTCRFSQLFIRRRIRCRLQERPEWRSAPAGEVALSVSERMQIGNPYVGTQIGRHMRLFTVPAEDSPLIGNAVGLTGIGSRGVPICKARDHRVSLD